jgi:hypothetical protein
MTNLQKLREALQDLTYLEMMIFAGWFANTDKPEDQLNDESFWASTINDWAQNAELAEDEDDQP